MINSNLQKTSRLWPYLELFFILNSNFQFKFYFSVFSGVRIIPRY